MGDHYKQIYRKNTLISSYGGTLWLGSLHNWIPRMHRKRHLFLYMNLKANLFTYFNAGILYMKLQQKTTLSGKMGTLCIQFDHYNCFWHILQICCLWKSSHFLALKYANKFMCIELSCCYLFSLYIWENIEHILIEFEQNCAKVAVHTMHMILKD